MEKRHLLSALIVGLMSLSLSAAGTATHPDTAKSKDFAGVVNYYRTHQEKSDNLAPHYNAGNAYFRLNDIPHAILCYERALRIDPANEDVAFNLALCRTKITDRFERPSEMFFITWIRQLVYGHSADVWGLWGLVFLAAASAGILLRCFSPIPWLRQVGLALGSILCLATLLCESFAFLQDRRFRNETRAVVMYETPFQPEDSSNGKARTLHEGTTITLLDESPDGQVQVELPDGKIGWTDSKQLEKVKV